MSAWTESQASSLEEADSSMEELISTVLQNTESTPEANRLAITELDAIIQQNAALTEQSATAAETLHEQAVKQWHPASAFKLVAGEHAARTLHCHKA